MKMIIAYIAPFKLDEVRDAVKEAGVTGLSAGNIQGFGRQAGHTETYRGQEYKVDLLPKVKLELVVAEARAMEVANILATAARSGKVGDGKIFLTNVVDAIRIRNDDRGEAAL